MPIGSDKAILRMRAGIYQRFKHKWELEHNPAGENYEVVKQMNIQPFNITDLREKDEAAIKKKKEKVFSFPVKLKGNRCVIKKSTRFEV